MKSSCVASRSSRSGSTRFKPLSAYLYIPSSSDHAPHILRAWIRGELIRYVKRSSAYLAFASLRLEFIRRLTVRGYQAAFLQPIFDRVDYANRERYLTPRVATPLSDSPAVVALTLPRTQRLDAMELQRVLFLCSERWLARNESVPLVVRQARFVLARSTVGKLSALLLDYRFPRS